MSIRFFLPFDDFKSPPLPQALDEYLAHRDRATAFVAARNRRIGEYARELA